MDSESDTEVRMTDMKHALGKCQLSLCKMLCKQMCPFLWVTNLEILQYNLVEEMVYVNEHEDFQNGYCFDIQGTLLDAAMAITIKHHLNLVPTVEAHAAHQDTLERMYEKKMEKFLSIWQ